MDKASLSIKPFKALPDEGNAVRKQIDGQVALCCHRSQRSSHRQPLVLARLLLGPRAPGRNRAAQARLPRRLHLVRRRQAVGRLVRLSHREARPVEEAGLRRHEPRRRNAYTWATAHPDKVSCIYADNPGDQPGRACASSASWPGTMCPCFTSAAASIRSWATTRWPSRTRYQQLGGRISVMIKEGAGHHPHSLRDPKPIADFIVADASARAASRPAFVDAGVHEVLITTASRARTATSRARKDLRHLPRAGVHGVLRPLRRPGPTAMGHARDGGDRAEGRRAGQALGLPGGLRSAGMRRSIRPCWPRGFTSSSAPLDRKTARCGSSGTPSTSSWPTTASPGSR